MFRKERVVVLFLLCSLLSFSLFYVINQKKALAYSERDLQRLFSKKKSETAESVAKQAREGISKQILYTKGGKRVEIRLNSHTSQLAYVKKSKELIESFTGISCLMQENKQFSGDDFSLSAKSACRSEEQIIRSFSAPEASYHYGKQMAEADEVTVAHYAMPIEGNLFSLEKETPFFEGVARKCELSLARENSFHSEKFELKLRGEKDEK